MRAKHAITIGHQLPRVHWGHSPAVRCKLCGRIYVQADARDHLRMGHAITIKKVIRKGAKR